MKKNVVVLGWALIAFSIILSCYFAYSIVLNMANIKSSTQLDPSLQIAFDSKYSLSELVEIQDMTSDKLKYQPWVQFGNYEHNNKYSSVKNGIRQSFSPEGCANEEILVWFFGGSTMYGWGVPWWNMIPSNLVKQASDQNKCIKAINYGVPYFFSKQEIVLFISEVMKEGKKPDLVVFLDGLNDFGQPGSSINGVPFFTPSLEIAIPYGRTINKDNPKKIAHFFEGIINSFYAIFKAENVGVNLSRVNYLVPENIRNKGENFAANKIVDNFINQRKALMSICSGYKVKCVQFLQPIAIKDYMPINSQDSLTEYVRSNPKFDQQRRLMLYGYAKLGKMIKDKDMINNSYTKIFDISDAFLAYNGFPYIDAGHYSPRASAIVSARILEKLF